MPESKWKLFEIMCCGVEFEMKLPCWVIHMFPLLSRDIPTGICARPVKFWKANCPLEYDPVELTRGSVNQTLSLESTVIDEASMLPSSGIGISVEVPRSRNFANLVRKEFGEPNVALFVEHDSKRK